MGRRYAAHAQAPNALHSLKSVSAANKQQTGHYLLLHVLVLILVLPTMHTYLLMQSMRVGICVDDDIRFKLHHLLLLILTLTYTCTANLYRIDAAFKLAITFVAGGTPKRKIQDTSASADANAKCLAPPLERKKMEVTGSRRDKSHWRFFFSQSYQWQSEQRNLPNYANF